ncbi:hypothetical protein VTJ83DRAFT_5691 [Remersonia thermophila]|uniref:Uncharacterized protein n=1 Tax=Remersonia thermophila TaxID=72144 RepID=A0ABR4D9T1_9PEZI
MSAPHTPAHSPQPSLDYSAASFGSFSPQQGRRQSKASSFNDSTTDLGFSAGVGDGGGGGGGLGNLADELAGAFYDGEDDDYDGYDDDGAYEDGADDEQGLSAEGPGIHLEDASAPDGGRSPKGGEGLRDGRLESSTLNDAARSSLNLTVPSPGRGGHHHHHHHHRRKGSEYDGSDYGSDSDLDSPGMPPRLVDRMDEIEALARRGTENIGSAADGAFKRVTEGLRDLSSQAGVESAATRLITAHTALTTHLNHQTRQIHNLTFPLLSPLAAPPSEDSVAALLPMLLTLTELLPRPSTSSLTALDSLHTLSADLALALNHLSDALHMARQTTQAAGRRLRGARELVAEMRRDEELRIEAEAWINRGGWGERLRKRECAGVCGDVVGGFEKVCESWRERLVALAEGESKA